jgi:hypothetical protein
MGFNPNPKLFNVSGADASLPHCVRQAGWRRPIWQGKKLFGDAKNEQTLDHAPET